VAEQQLVEQGVAELRDLGRMQVVEQRAVAYGPRRVGSVGSEPVMARTIIFTIARSATTSSSMMVASGPGQLQLAGCRW
jgi:hypothetical protein